MKVCVTGSKGLIGSSITDLLINSKAEVYGIDNNNRNKLFGTDGSTDVFSFSFFNSTQYKHFNFDLKDIDKLKSFFKKYQFDAVIHCASQPSHPKSIAIPILDFEMNTSVTLNLLEILRYSSPKTTFIFTSTNKVYGDNPNLLSFVEKEKRFDFEDSSYLGIDETMSIDTTTHTPFGVSKTAADLYVQEYGSTYKMNTVALRLGCVTGKYHASVKQHGFLSFLIKSIIKTRSYEIIGFKGKQVRDQISSEDVALAMLEILKSSPKSTIYNLGGGKKNALSILEAIDLITEITGIKPKLSIKRMGRLGDHRCYYTNNSKFLTDYPNWNIKDRVEKIIEDIIRYEIR